ncbi:hypothetical protein [Thermoproteus tenax]|uniref:Uncharacterized protein n=1 Tax=Thermoproteus tenax (strain ATCC 35583 / DSM 2078 / JCM 9277 / NBRC 100435 / Kra 1) TaxID=768679 RepID=G4RN34_THETK|nr:hypothetical protein [Thermoproteus tenax]CCC80978.1 hypothetical protein TTX_0301 [Thermoproteus tenax Kra 1]
MEKVSVRLASRSYADASMAEMLMALPGIYNVYVEGEYLTLEIDEGAIAPAEAIRRVMDLGYEVVLRHYVYSVRRGRADPWRIKERLEEDPPPFVVAATYDVDEDLLYIATVPGARRKDVEAFIASRGVAASYLDEYDKPIRLSFG